MASDGWQWSIIAHGQVMVKNVQVMVHHGKNMVDTDTEIMVTEWLIMVDHVS